MVSTRRRLLLAGLRCSEHGRLLTTFLAVGCVAHTDGTSLRNRELTAEALRYLEATSGDDGYYLMVEGGRVDHANHDGARPSIVCF